MPQRELNPETAKLRDRMVGPPPSHSRFVGEPIDWAQVDALDLGDLWATAKGLVRSARGLLGSGLAIETAQAILKRGREMVPAFRGPACWDYLDPLVAEAENSRDEPGYLSSRTWEEVRFALSRCTDLAFDGLGEVAGRLLAALEWKTRPHLALALARLAGCETSVLARLSDDLAGSPLLLEELRAAMALDIATNIAMDKRWHPAAIEDDLSHGTAGLTDDPDYAAFGETMLRQAADRVRAIHDGALPYASDKAFTVRESEVIARLASVMLERDEAWLPPVLHELFRKVSLAPTAAKTLPSQSVAIALGHAIEAFPTPEAVETLRTVLRDMRHAGVKKKLQRNIRGAERGLADRPEVALRLPADQPVSKQQLKTLARALEAGLATGMTMDYADWRSRLAEHPQARDLAASLVWRMQGADENGPSVLPAIERGRLVLRDAAGRPVPVPEDCRVVLWHPCDATAAERHDWRERVAALRIKQPFKQVFREHYAVTPDELAGTATSLFAGLSVSVMPFLGLARRERWDDGYSCLKRAFGRWTVELDLADNIFPGLGGGTTTGKLRLLTSRRHDAKPARLGDLPAAMLSEILRAVDLLVSVSGFAVSDRPYEPQRDSRLFHLGQASLGAMEEMRRQALQHALRGLDGAANLQFDAHHLRVGSYAIHLATGRVTRDGDPVTIDLPERTKLSAVPWLPYDEKLLETICYTAIELMSRKMRA